MSQQIRVPEGLSCPFCDGVISGATQVADARRSGLQKGTITVCTRCGNPSRLGDSNFVKMKSSEFEALDMPTKNAVQATISAVKRIMGAGKG